MPVKNNISLKPYNTFGIDLKAKYFSEITSVPNLKEAVDFARDKQIPLLILGGGSNVLFTADFNGIVIKNSIPGRKIVKETDSYLLLNVKGGEDWPALVDYCVANGWGGIENLSLIPGTVGAAPVQNIGAYGTEVKDVVVEVEVFDLLSGKTVIIPNKACAFGYRSSIFKNADKGRYFVLSVTFKLTKNAVPKLDYAPLKKIFENRKPGSVTAKEVSEAVKQIRRSKLPDPEQLGNAGSFFNNPVVSENKFQELKAGYPNIPSYPLDNHYYKLAAGWLIEQAGWKGKQIGDAGVHKQQALVLVNYGNASGKDILNLALQVKESVNEKFGIELEFEVNILP